MKALMALVFIQLCIPIIGLITAVGVMSALRSLAVYRRDQITPHMTAVEVNRIRREYARRLRALEDSV